ncbi:MAG: DUF1080 domain-containing protein [Verrucomicrobiota bacterium]
MNIKILWTAAALVVGVGLAGCESSRYEPATVLPGGQPAVLPPQPQLAEIELIAHAAAQPSAPIEGEGWRPLFDGRSLTGWKVTDFKQGGSVEVRDGLLVFFKGDNFVGVNCTNEIPKANYELTFEAMRLAGDDFFCGLTFPVNDSFCSLIVGGWGGGLVGLSNLDGADASENETTKFITFEKGRWYRVRLRVTEQKIEAWIEQKQVVDVNTVGRKVSLRFGDIERSKPFGLASWSTSAAFRGLKLRPVTAP